MTNAISWKGVFSFPTLELVENIETEKTEINFFRDLVSNIHEFICKVYPFFTQAVKNTIAYLKAFEGVLVKMKTTLMDVVSLLYIENVSLSLFEKNVIQNVTFNNYSVMQCGQLINPISECSQMVESGKASEIQTVLVKYLKYDKEISLQSFEEVERVIIIKKTRPLPEPLPVA